MARIHLEEARALTEPTKLDIENLDFDLLSLIETEVLARLSVQVATDTVASWVDPITTPDLVRTIIAEKYVAILYNRQYSEDNDTQSNMYAIKLDARAEMLLSGILDGSIVIIGLNQDITTITFYPDDASSAQDRKNFPDDPSVGPAAFSMGSIY
jgi:hypothetical protein